MPMVRRENPSLGLELHHRLILGRPLETPRTFDFAMRQADLVRTTNMTSPRYSRDRGFRMAQVFSRS